MTLTMAIPTDSFDDLISITLPDNNDTYTISDPAGTYTDITIGGTSLDNSTWTTTYNGIPDTLTINGGYDSTITLGTTTITEETLKKVLTIIDMFEQDEELSEILKSQIALNKLGE